MKKKISILVILCCMMFLTACSSKLSDEKISETVTPEIKKVIAESENIDSIEVIEITTNDETKDTVADIKVVTNDGVIEYTRYYTTRYIYTEEKEWYLGSLSESTTENTIIRPISGVTEAMIINSLDNCLVDVEGEKWKIKKSKVKDLSIIEQTTELETMSDVVVVSFSIDDAVQQASGQMYLKYAFNEKWELSEYREKTNFIAETKPECELEITTELIMSAIEGKEIDIKNDIYSYQTIAISKDNISNMEICDEKVTNKGRNIVVLCKCELKVGFVTMEMNFEIPYYYENEWLPQSMDINYKIKDIDIVGKWNGRYTGIGNDKGSMTLEINEVSDDGKVMGTYSYTPDTIDKYHKAGSYKVSGEMDMETLYVKLKAGDWITKDSTATFVTKQDISIYFRLKDGKIEGVGQNSCPFVAERE